MSMKEIKVLLQESIGLHSESIGDTSIERAIIHRMDALSIERNRDYLSRLIDDQDELDELVEEVVVPETWFFRNLVPFEALTKCIPDLFRDTNDRDEPLRILSIPCSTGEEPYSIAITLLKSGVKPGAFQIDAVDISKRALKKARRAIYGKHSFRESNGIADVNFFQPTRSGQQILPKVKDHVKFIRGNILKDNFSPYPEYYDIIFCRNLLIYFDKETKTRVIDKLNYLLKKKGTLFVGHAETTGLDNNSFTKLDVPKAFAYKKRDANDHSAVDKYDEQPENKLRLIYDQLVNVTVRDIELSRKRKESFSSTLKKSVVRRDEDSKISWWNIERLIEQGKLSAASTLCEEWLESEPEVAQGYYYLGLISSLEGNIGSADALLKKAIYLDPNHHKALGLSALLAEERGESVAAESLRFRELRAKKRSQ